MFSSAESLLEKSVGVFEPSSRSVIEAIEFYVGLESEKLARKAKFDLAKSLLPAEIAVGLNSDFYSYFPIVIKNRNDIRRKLMDHNIFLAIHWPEINSVRNIISEQILSLPLDSRYSLQDVTRLCILINRLIGNISE